MSFHSQDPNPDRYGSKEVFDEIDAEAYRRSVPDGQPYSTSYRRLGTRMGVVYGMGESAPGPFYYSTLLAGPYGDEATAEFTLELLKS